MSELRRAIPQASRREGRKHPAEMKHGLWLMVAHELRNPLVGVQRVIELAIKECCGMRPKVRRLLTDARTNCELVLNLMDDIVDVQVLQNKRTTSVKTEVNLRVVIKNCICMLQFLAEEKTIKFEIMLPRDMPHLLLDEHRLTRILLNLLHNALKFSPNSETIEVAARIKEAGHLLISVTDLGNGIPSDQLKQIVAAYDPQNCARQNVGLRVGWGLYYCATTVTALGGELWVESPLEGLQRGSRFCFTLPIFQKEGR